MDTPDPHDTPPPPQQRPPSDAVGAAIDVLADRWTFLLLREAFFRVRRFTDFRENLGISRKVLSERLDRLVDDGLLHRVPYQDRPVRHEYRLTDKGLDLFPMIVALMQWGERWVLGSAPLSLHHRDDGGPVRARLTCDTCGDELHAREVTWRRTSEEVHGREET